MILAMLNHLWQSSLCVVGLGALAFLLREYAAHVRYWLWLAASIKFLVPFALLVGIGAHFAPPSAAPWPQNTPVSVAVLAEELSTPFSAENLKPQMPDRAKFDLASLAVTLWLVGGLSVLTSWSVNWMRLRVLVRNAKLLPIAAPIRVLSAPDSFEPSLVGIWHPVLLMPEGLARQLSGEQILGTRIIASASP